LKQSISIKLDKTTITVTSEALGSVTLGSESAATELAVNSGRIPGHYFVLEDLYIVELNVAAGTAKAKEQA
jgi:hypothetical protein